MSGEMAGINHVYNSFWIKLYHANSVLWDTLLPTKSTTVAINAIFFIAATICHYFSRSNLARYPSDDIHLLWHFRQIPPYHVVLHASVIVHQAQSYSSAWSWGPGLKLNHKWVWWRWLYCGLHNSRTCNKFFSLIGVLPVIFPQKPIFHQHNDDIWFGWKWINDSTRLISFVQRTEFTVPYPSVLTQHRFCRKLKKRFTFGTHATHTHAQNLKYHTPLQPN